MYSAFKTSWVSGLVVVAAGLIYMLFTIASLSGSATDGAVAQASWLTMAAVAIYAAVVATTELRLLSPWPRTRPQTLLNVSVAPPKSVTRALPRQLNCMIMPSPPSTRITSPFRIHLPS